MNSEPPYQAMDNEIAYRWKQEVTAMGKSNDAELEQVCNMGFKPIDYLTNT